MEIIHKEQNESKTAFIAVIAFLAYLAYNSYTDWRYLIAPVPVVALELYLTYKIKYFVYDEWLYLKSGFLSYKEIDVFEIAAISVVNIPVKRISVVKKDGKVVQASINDTEKFVTSLKAINPGIEVK